MSPHQAVKAISEKRLLAIIALLLALLGGLLLILGSLHLSKNLSFEVLGKNLLSLILGVVIIIGGIAIYREDYKTGGFLNLIIGVAAALLVDLTSGILAVLSGVLGLLCSG